MRSLPRRIRLPVCLLISVVPLNILRVLLHRIVNGYQISFHATIGFGTLLLVDKATIGRASIGLANRFDGPYALVIEDGANIGPINSFVCIWDAASRQPKEGRYLKYCRIGRDAHVTENHYIDAAGGFELGANSWLAGCSSQFWTHGVKNAPVTIGRDCYVSSAARFAPGSRVGDKVLVALGSVVTKEFDQDNVMIGGVPASIIRDN